VFGDQDDAGNVLAGAVSGQQVGVGGPGGLHHVQTCQWPTRAEEVMAYPVDIQFRPVPGLVHDRQRRSWLVLTDRMVGIGSPT
jgi:hypothetical protein